MRVTRLEAMATTRVALRRILRAATAGLVRAMHLAVGVVLDAAHQPPASRVREHLAMGLAEEVVAGIT